MFRTVGIRRLLGVIVVIVCIAVPLVEAFDSWDRTLEDGNDTEANAVLVAVTVGVALSLAPKLIAQPLVALPDAAGVGRGSAPATPLAERPTVVPVPVPTGSPPLALRI